MKSRIRTTVKKVQKSLETGALESARPALTQAISLMDRASSKGIVHRRTASRKISRLSKKLHQLSAPAASTD
jgi:small subunit ribosomal protein S20